MAKKAVHFDVIVVGGGSAGCALASRLSEDPKRSVLLIEAGPDFKSAAEFPEILLGRNENWVEDEYTWGYPAQLTADPLSIGTVIRGRTIGGSSSVNGGVFLRGLPEDFELWGSPSWTWEHVLRCYKRSETDLDFPGDIHGSTGPVPVHRTPRDKWAPLFEAFHEACVGLGIEEATDLNNPGQSGVGPIPRNYRDGIRVNSAIAYLEPARKRLNLTVRGESLVSRVLFDRRRAIGVELVAEGQIETLYGDMVVLCAGALVSPMILLRSGIGPARDVCELDVPLVHDLPGVGARLHDHAVVKIALRAHSGTPFPGPNDPGRMHCLLVHSAGPLFRNDMHVMPAYLSDCIVLAPSLNFGLSCGRLKATSADPTALPTIVYNFLQDPIDCDRMLETIRLALELATTKSMSAVVSGRIAPSDEDAKSAQLLETWLRSNIISSFHSSGTCPIGAPTDGLAVVDDRCRVHGLEGLAVADLSIMPRTVRANTNATAIMIGERAAELLG